MAKYIERVIKPLYDVSVYNHDHNTNTIYKGATLKFLIESLNSSWHVKPLELRYLWGIGGKGWNGFKYHP